MKKLLILLACATTFVACTKEETPTVENGEPITFGNLSTRAVETIDDFNTVNGFGIWACVSGIYDTDKSYEPILTNEKVYIPTNSNTWTYDKTQYWVPQYMFYFLGLYPYSDSEENSFKVDYYEAEKARIYTLEVTANGSADTEDILVATHVTNTLADYSTTVPLAFEHILTNVNLVVSQDFDMDPDFNYYVTGVTISGIKGKGTYLCDPYNGVFYKGWEEIVEDSEFSVVKEFEEPVLLRKFGDANPKVLLSVWGDEGLLLIPQQIGSTDVKLRIDYLYDVNLDDEDMGTAKYTEAYIPSIIWEQGKAIKYSIAISSKSNISFTAPSIEPWGATQTGGTIIIR